jgi:hypothetical protein
LLYSKSTTNPQQIYNKSTTFRLFDKSTTNPQHLDMSRCYGFVVDSTTNPQQIETVEYGLRLVHNKSKSCTSSQQIHNFTTSRTACCTTNPKQIHNKSNKCSWSFTRRWLKFARFSGAFSFVFIRQPLCTQSNAAQGDMSSSQTFRCDMTALFYRLATAGPRSHRHGRRRP